MVAESKNTESRQQNTEQSSVDRRSFLGMGALAAAGALAAGCSQSEQAAAPAAAPAKAGPAPYVDGETVETTFGKIKGSRRGDIHAFRGVPYGAPTGGNNRFLPASAPAPWTDVKTCAEIGPRAPQTQARIIHEWGVLYRLEAASEECLVLNVWSKGLADNAKRPVMVWLHGGGFAGGSSGGLPYDGTNLANVHDVVFVGVNHRLNVFGFLYLPEVGGEKYSQASNVGMLDVVLALQWVKDNIEKFGGDPNNVTILGQSGGGSKVSTLLGMPAAKGLFHRAIAQSGSQVRSLTPDQGTATARAVLKAVNLKPNQIDQLQQMPYYVLRDALTDAEGVGQFAPVMDSRTIPAHNFDPVATPISEDVPLMIGSTDTEITWNTFQNYDKLDEASLRHYVRGALRSDDATADRLIALYRASYPSASNLDLFLKLGTDASNFRRGTGLQAERKAALGKAPVFKYHFGFYSPVRDGELRSMHCMDIPFALHNTQIAGPVLGTAPELQGLEEKMSTAWATFARTGNPNHPGIPEWKPFTLEARDTMVFNIDTKAVPDYKGEELRAVNAVLDQPRPARRG